MNNLRSVWGCLLQDTTSWSGCLRRLHLSLGLKQHPGQQRYVNNENVESSLWFTTLPSRKKRALSLADRKKAKMKTGPIPSGPLVIECKNKQFNHYRGMQYGKFDVVPLTSKGWGNRKAKGQYFRILPMTQHPAFLMSPKEALPTTFEEAGVCDEIIGVLNKMGVSEPTTIQAKGIQALLNGSNVLMTAETGCGKTLAYLIPLIQTIMKWKSQTPILHNAPCGIVLLPTRELALQVGEVAQQLCLELGLKCVTLIGGKASQIINNPVVEPVDLLVTSLGVICKLSHFKMYSMELCRHVVVDEADTLLDDSFSDSLKYFFKKTKLNFIRALSGDGLPSSQLCLCSATMPTSIRSILDGVIIVDDLEKISTRYLHKVQPHICQEFLRLSKLEKPERLLRIVKANTAKRIPTMIFSNKTPTCNWISVFLNDNGIKTVRVNGQMYAEERLGQYQYFKYGAVDVISCTDVASRGLDSTRVKHVVNYEFPHFMADYVHRCGRTGRIGHDRDCRVTNFISRRGEVQLVNEIEQAARTDSAFARINNNISRILKYRAPAAGVAGGGT